MSSAWAFHETMGISGTSGDMLIPLIIVVLLAVGLIFLGGKKSRKGKAGRAQKRKQVRRR